MVAVGVSNHRNAIARAKSLLGCLEQQKCLWAEIPAGSEHSKSRRVDTEVRSKQPFCTFAAPGQGERATAAYVQQEVLSKAKASSKSLASAASGARNLRLTPNPAAQDPVTLTANDGGLSRPSRWS